MDGELYPAIAAPLGEVTTERLELRHFRLDDLDGLAAVFAHPEVWQYPYGRAFTRDETATFLQVQVDQYAARGFGCWIAIERASDLIVGYVGISVPTFLPAVLPAVEVGWRFEPAVWGRGYATEGATAALDEAFTTLALDEVCSLPQSDNVASVRVAERLGLRRERTIAIPANETRGSVDAEHFVITRDEWLAGRD